MLDYVHKIDGVTYCFICWGGKVLLEKYVVLKESGNSIDYEQSWFRPINTSYPSYQRREWEDEPAVPPEIRRKAVEHFKSQIKFVTWEHR